LNTAQYSIIISARHKSEKQETHFASKVNITPANPAAIYGSLSLVICTRS
jgi:hypothetical protein